jgi:hypothetical protein
MTLAPTCFDSRRNHHQGAVLCLAKTTSMVLLCSSIQTQSMSEQVSSFLIFFKHFYDFMIVCISWNNKEYFDTTDARCKHEDYM